MPTVDGPSGTNPDQGVDNWEDFGDSGDYNNFEADDPFEGLDSDHKKQTSSNPKYGPQPGAPGTGKNLGMPGGQGTALGGDPGSPVNDPAVAEHIQALLNQGKTPQQIVQILAQQGVHVSEGDVLFAQEGWGAAHDRGYGYGPGATKNLGGGNPMGPISKNYGSPYWNNYMQNQNMANEAREGARKVTGEGKEQMVKLHMILLQIMMGDITGALRSYAVLMDRDLRKFARMVVNKLGKVRQARSRVIRNFATKKPPRAYAGQDAGAAARAQDRSQRYTQFVQLSTQLMSELQNTERELVDALQTMFRDMENFWQSYATMRDEKFRTDNRVMRIQ